MFIKLTVALMAAAGLATGGMYYYSSMSCDSMPSACCHSIMQTAVSIDSPCCSMETATATTGECSESILAATATAPSCCSAKGAVAVVNEEAPMPRLVSR